jgi:hypothetical protein
MYQRVGRRYQKPTRRNERGRKRVPKGLPEDTKL